MKNNEKIDEMLNPTVSDALFFVFVAPGSTVPDSYHHTIDDPKDLDGSLERVVKQIETSLKNCSWFSISEQYAVFIHRQCDFRYIYYTTIMCMEKNQ